MMREIITSETKLISLLPENRLATKPSPQLLTAAAEWSELVWNTALALGPITLSEAEIEAATELNRKPVFVCGTHRSGTTLVRDLLDNHPSLSVLPSEGTFITNIEPWLKRAHKKQHKEIVGKEWLRRLMNPSNQPPYWLLGRTIKTYSPYVQFARSFMAWWDLLEKKHENSFWPLTAVMLSYAKPGNRTIQPLYWVDKTPTNERFLKRLWQEFPEAKIIHIVRDPVAILSSRKKMESWSDVRTFVREIQCSFKVAAKQAVKKDDRYLLVNYEALCAQPENITRQLAGFLGIEYTSSLLRPTVAGKISWVNTSFHQSMQGGKILQPENIHREVLVTPQEQKMLSAYVGADAGKLGYESIPLSTLWNVFIRIKFGL